VNASVELLYKFLDVDGFFSMQLIAMLLHKYAFPFHCMICLDIGNENGNGMVCIGNNNGMHCQWKWYELSMVSISNGGGVHWYGMHCMEMVCIGIGNENGNDMV
jgi:hypothetical protein